MIIVKFVTGRQSAVFLARNVDQAVLDEEDLERIFVFMLVQVSIKSIEILAVELKDRFTGSNGGQVRAQSWKLLSPGWSFPVPGRSRNDKVQEQAAHPGSMFGLHAFVPEVAGHKKS